MARSLEWQIAAVKAIKVENPKVKTFTLALPAWLPHRAGQHYDVRLTAEDGYQAQRSYSIASAPEREGEIELTVELIQDGEVSTYMHEVLVPGDRLEVRGPIGGYFVWEATMEEPLLLIAGGSGVVPLMSMIRHRAAAGARVSSNGAHRGNLGRTVQSRRALPRSRLQRRHQALAGGNQPGAGPAPGAGVQVRPLRSRRPKLARQRTVRPPPVAAPLLLDG